MAQLEIQFTRNDKLANFDAIFVDVTTPRMAALGERGVAAVQQGAPVDRSVFRNSIATSVDVQPQAVSVSVYSQADPVVVSVIEDGRAAGTWPNLDAIRGWVARKLGAAGKAIASVAFLVARKIKERGIPGRHVFRNAFESMQPQIDKTTEEITAEIAKRI